LIKKSKKTGKGSGRERPATTEENGDVVEELVCSQEYAPGPHISPHNIAMAIIIASQLTVM